MSGAIQEESFAFAVRIVRLYKYMRTSKQEYIMTKQLLRSGTSIGANVAEAQQAQSRADFINKLNIALKEAYETHYWIRLLNATDYLTAQQYHSIASDCAELERLLIAILRSTKE